MYAVIMAGGKGTRFWPKSRESSPKHLLNILGTGTLIQETVERIKPLVPEKRIFVVTGRSHADALIHQLPRLPVGNILVEPVGRNTAPCIGLAALHIRKMNPEGIMIVLPSDHFIGDRKGFLRILSAGAETAGKGSYLLTVGVKPTRPETGYGYVEQGEAAMTVGGETICRVSSFREKPPLDEARTFLQADRFFWNSGIFIWKAASILSAIERFMPDLYKGLQTIDAAIGTATYDAVVAGVYEHIKPASIDYGVMEMSPDVLLIRGDFSWNDVGSWDALWDVLEKDEKGNAVIGLGLPVMSSNSLVYSHGKLVALLGVDDLIVVDTEDALLVCRRGLSQEVRSVVEILEKKNMKNCL